MSSRTTHVLAIVGAVVVFVATAISWYTRDVSFAANVGGLSYASSKSYTLWDLTTLAPVLVVIAAALGAGLDRPQRRPIRGHGRRPVDGRRRVRLGG
jgi:hypothetical protein